jgi:hypothetical protein
MKSLKLVVPVIIILFLSSCDALIFENGSGEMVMESYEIDDFSEISLEGNFEVFLKNGDDRELVIQVDDNLKEFIEVYNRGDILHISTSKRIRSDEGIKVFVTYEALERLSSGGASSIFTENTIRSKELELSLTGAGLMEIALETDQLKIRLSGAGLINIEGETEYLNLGMSGAGSFEGEDLMAKDATISISGVGSAQVNVTGELSAKVSGIGGIEYAGNPQKVNRKVSGIGKIVKAD